MKTLLYSTFPTPVGDFTVAVDDGGSVIATAFGGVGELLRRSGRSKLMDSPTATASARFQVEAYFGDPLAAFTVPLGPEGTPYQKRVWEALRSIPPGQTKSYGRLAAELRSSPRAVGQANAANPICLIVPCHRVIGSDGSLNGFAFGQALKRRLLEHEGALAPLAAGGVH
ncbi:MAG: methylated-DNA--[protein]-cysteine S-methyltransferase [Opitutaceae bacterium]